MRANYLKALQEAIFEYASGLAYLAASSTSLLRKHLNSFRSLAVFSPRRRPRIQPHRPHLVWIILESLMQSWRDATCDRAPPPAVSKPVRSFIQSIVNVNVLFALLALCTSPPPCLTIYMNRLPSTWILDHAFRSWAECSIPTLGAVFTMTRSMLQPNSPPRAGLYSAWAKPELRAKTYRRPR